MPLWTAIVVVVLLFGLAAYWISVAEHRLKRANRRLLLIGAEREMQRVIDGINEANYDKVCAENEKLHVALHVMVQQAFQAVNRDYRELSDDDLLKLYTAAMDHDHDTVARFFV